MTERLDRAIRAAMDATHEPGDVRLLHRQYAQALIADLLEGLDWPDEAETAFWNMCLTEIRTRADIEDQS
jgi:hypothetical protein